MMKRNTVGKVTITGIEVTDELIAHIKGNNAGVIDVIPTGETSIEGVAIVHFNMSGFSNRIQTSVKKFVGDTPMNVTTDVVY